MPHNGFKALTPDSRALERSGASERVDVGCAAAPRSAPRQRHRSLRESSKQFPTTARSGNGDPTEVSQDDEQSTRVRLKSYSLLRFVSFIRAGRSNQRKHRDQLLPPKTGQIKS